MSQYHKQSEPPVCLHILGQSLVDALWQEGQELKAQLNSVISQSEAQFKCGDRYATFNKQTINALKKDLE